MADRNIRDEVAIAAIIGLPLLLVAGLLNIGRPRYALVAAGGGLLYLVLVAVGLNVVDRKTYYLWTVVRNSWRIVVPIFAAGFITYQLYQYFAHQTYVVSKGWDPVAAAWIAALCGPVLRSGYRRVVRFSRLRPFPTDVIRLTAAYPVPNLADDHVGHKRVGADGFNDHEVRLTFSPGLMAAPLTVTLIVIERLKPSGITSGVVWTSERIWRLRPMAVRQDGDTGRPEGRLVNPEGRMHRVVVGGVCELSVFISDFGKQDKGWFAPQSRFSVSAYLAEGGIVRGMMTIPGASAA